MLGILFAVRFGNQPSQIRFDMQHPTHILLCADIYDTVGFVWHQGKSRQSVVFHLRRRHQHQPLLVARQHLQHTVSRRSGIGIMFLRMEQSLQHHRHGTHLRRHLPHPRSHHPLCPHLPWRKPLTYGRSRCGIGYCGIVFEWEEGEKYVEHLPKRIKTMINYRRQILIISIVILILMLVNIFVLDHCNTKHIVYLSVCSCIFLFLRVQ